MEASRYSSSPLFLNIQHKHSKNQPRQVTEDEQREIASAFDKLADGGQFVLARHVKLALRAMGFPVKKADVQDLLREHGISENAGLDYRSFYEVVSSKVVERTPQDEVRRAFQLFDLNHTGKITLKDLSLISKQLQCDIEEEQLKDMIAEFDKDGDGAINEEEFRAIVAPLED